MSYNTRLLGELKFDRELGQRRMNILDDLTIRRQDSTRFPGVLCPWEVNQGGDGIGQEESEGVRDYVEWLRFLIENYFKPWGITLNGRVDWEGEENSDMGQMHVTDNVLVVKEAVITFEEVSE